eukprot:scaffold248471_cov36-Tisochrysis_lutea.AAC.3
MAAHAMRVFVTMPPPNDWLDDPKQPVRACRLSEASNSLGSPFICDITKMSHDAICAGKVDGASKPLLLQAEVAAILVAVATSLSLDDFTIQMTITIVHHALCRGFVFDMYSVRPVLIAALNLAAKQCAHEVRRVFICGAQSR